MTGRCLRDSLENCMDLGGDLLRQAPEKFDRRNSLGVRPLKEMDPPGNA